MGRKYVDITGQQFGEWIVLSKSDKKLQSKAIVWICKCSCGTVAEIAGTDLRSGKTKQCKQHKANIEKRPVRKSIPNRGIRHNYNDNIIGQKFGKLQIIEKDVVKSDGTYLKCKCDCGNIIIARLNNIRSGKTLSCGCLKSKGEEKIASILRKANIDFQQQYSFKDLKGPNDGLLRFDFAIFKNNKLIKLIEYQGEFHYQSPPNGWTDVRNSDEIKQKYCEENKISLLLIPYWEFDNINLEYLLMK